MAIFNALVNAILEDNGDWQTSPTVSNLEATDGNVAAGGTSDNPLVRVGFITPDPLNDGAGLQSIEVYAAMTANKSGVPTIHLELYENGSTLGVTTGPFNLTSQTHSAFELTFDSSILSGDGTDVELRVTGTAGGSGGQRNGVAVDSIIWYADSTPPPPPPVITVHPQDTNFTEGGNANLTANGTGYDSIEWFYKEFGGSFVQDVAKDDLTSVTFTALTEVPDDGAEVRADFINAYGTTQSDIATLSLVMEQKMFLGALDILDMQVGTTPVLAVYFGTQLVWTAIQAPIQYYTPDGVDDFILGGVQYLDIANDDHMVFEFNIVDGLSGGGTICSQNISSVNTEKGLQLWTSASSTPSSMRIYIGGADNVMLNMMLDGDHKYKVDYTRGGDCVGYRDDVEISRETCLINTNYETTAKFKLLARSNDGVDAQGFFCDHVVYNFTLTVDSVLLFDCPIDDTWANNPTIVNNGSGGTVTAQNFQEVSWSEF